MMKGAQHGRYGEVEGCRVLELPYRGHGFSMIVLLPDRDRFREFEEKLTPARLWDLLTLLKTEDLQLTLPRFTSTSAFSLAPVLSAMGMPSAFGPQADFSGISGKRGLFISAVLHQAFVEVREKGTEAAASTGVAMSKGISRPGRQVVVDHPFLYVIRDEQTDSILFLGRAVDPR